MMLIKKEQLMRIRKYCIVILSVIAGIIIGMMKTKKTVTKAVMNEREFSDKHLSLFLMMNQWVKIKQEGKQLSSYFEENGYHKIAIYGMSYAGETLAQELKESDVKVEYGIDRNAAYIYADFAMFPPDGELQDVDAIVVTSIKYYDEIEEQLSLKMECPILSLEDILYEM